MSRPDDEAEPVSVDDDGTEEADEPDTQERARAVELAPATAGEAPDDEDKEEVLIPELSEGAVPNELIELFHELLDTSRENNERQHEKHMLQLQLQRQREQEAHQRTSSEDAHRRKMQMGFMAFLAAVVFIATGFFATGKMVEGTTLIGLIGAGAIGNAAQSYFKKD